MQRVVRTLKTWRWWIAAAMLLLVTAVGGLGMWISDRQPQAGMPSPATGDMVNRTPANIPMAQGQQIGVGWVRDYDVWMIARTIYGEARGEPYVGQVAVGAVIINRVKSPNFPNTVAGVIFQPWAFTCVNDGQLWLPFNETALKAARDAVAGWDPTWGALYYFNPNTATSGWIWSRPYVTTIGKHRFTR